MRKIIISKARFCVFILCMSLSGYAVSAGPSGKQKIDHLFQRHVDGNLAVFGVNDWNNPDGCDNGSRVTVAGGNPRFKEFYAAILIAKTTNKDFQAYTSGCISWNGVTYPRVVGVFTY